MGGPPVEAYYSQIFHPEFDVYDGSKYIKSLKGDFVVHEPYMSKTTFQYKKRVGEANCLRQPQDWADFNGDIDEWTWEVKFVFEEEDVLKERRIMRHAGYPAKQESLTPQQIIPSSIPHSMQSYGRIWRMACMLLRPK